MKYCHQHHSVSVNKEMSQSCQIRIELFLNKYKICCNTPLHFLNIKNHIYIYIYTNILKAANIK